MSQQARQAISRLAGAPAPRCILADITALWAAYTDRRPDPSLPGERVNFGTSGHRGSSLDGSFNEGHVLALTQAICDWRRLNGVDGPLHLGIDTHALSQPALDTTLEVLAANEVTTRIARRGEFTPTPAISHAIVAYNFGRNHGLADGIVLTPSHNPPDSGGFKYNPPHGGPATTDVTSWIGKRANDYLEGELREVNRMPLQAALKAPTTREHDFLNSYVADLGSVVDFDAIRGAGLHVGVDPMGGAGVHYWRAIAEHYRIHLAVISEKVNAQFSFMTVDWDGRIRMDPSSRWAMRRLIDVKDDYDLALACDTDHDRHGIVTPHAGLMPPNHYLSVLACELFSRRSQWPTQAALGKTVVTTAMLDRVAQQLDRELYEVPVGFKWFAHGLLDNSLGVACEESAGASVLRRDGSVWTTDKDGIALALLAAEVMALTGRDPAELYDQLEDQLGPVFSARTQAKANPAQKQALAVLEPEQLTLGEKLAGDKLRQVMNRAPGNDEPIHGIKVVTEGGWFAARPSGTEDIYKVYAESFKNEDHLQRLMAEAQQIVDGALASANEQPAAQSTASTAPA